MTIVTNPAGAVTWRSPPTRTRQTRAIDRHRRPFTRLVALAAALAAFAAASPGRNDAAGLRVATPTPRLTTAACRFPVPAGYSVRCHDLTVAERAGGARTIALHVAIYPATTATPAPDPVVFLAGGPGDDATGAVRTLVAGGAFDAVLAQRELVVFDQRGSGASRPSLACLSDDTLDGCRDRLAAAGVDLAAYTNDANAADVIALADALGARTVDLFGVSYGTRLALTVAALRPGLVRSLVLDSVAPPQTELGVASLATFEQSLEGLFRACEQGAACRRRFPALRTMFDRTLARLAASPFRFGALQGEAPADPDEAFGPADLALLVWELLQSTDAIPYLPLLLEAAAADDFLTVFDFLGGLSGVGGAGGVSVGTNYSVECTGPERLQTDRQLRDAARALRPAIREKVTQAFGDLADACAMWDVPPPASLPAAVRSDAPALLLSGSLDSSTPSSNAVLVARTLPRAVSVVIPGSGHITFARNTCARAIVARFLERPTRRTDTSCTRRAAPVAFVEQWPTGPGEVASSEASSTVATTAPPGVPSLFNPLPGTP